MAHLGSGNHTKFGDWFQAAHPGYNLSRSTEALDASQVAFTIGRLRFRKLWFLYVAVVWCLFIIAFAVGAG